LLGPLKRWSLFTSGGRVTFERPVFSNTSLKTPNFDYPARINIPTAKIVRGRGNLRCKVN